MKTQATLLAILLSAAGTTWASGVDINSVDLSRIQPTKSDTTEITEIKVQGPTDSFNVIVKSNDKEKVDTSKLKQSYNGKS